MWDMIPKRSSLALRDKRLLKSEDLTTDQVILSEKDLNPREEMSKLMRDFNQDRN